MPRKQNNNKVKENILLLRSQGKSYNEMANELGCSKSTISYHCGDGSEKKRTSNNNKRKTKKSKICQKINSFKSRVSRKVFRGKVKTFKRRKIKSRSHTKVNNISQNYTYEDVIKKIGSDPRCYLTGKRIDLNKTNTYNFDHIIPASKGGTNDLDNLALCTPSANYAKGDLSLNELYKLCEDILEWKKKNTKL